MNGLVVALIVVLVLGLIAVTIFAISKKKKVDPVVKAQIATALNARKSWRKAVKDNSKQFKLLSAQLETLTSQTGKLIASFGGVKIGRAHV